MSSHLKIIIDPEYSERYRQYVSGLDLPTEQIDELISIVHSILSYFVDQAFHVETDQITLRSIGKDFTGSLNHDMIEDYSETPNQ